jgi:NAD+ kinase
VNVRRVAIVTHPDKPGLPEAQRELEDFLTGKGIGVDGESPDLVISLGGDGTTLRGAQRAHHEDVPLLGVNRGLLGYLSEVEAGDETQALERVLAGDFTVEERMMLSCTIDDRAFGVGLNEVLVERAERQRLVHLGVEVGGERLAGFDADGVIVATPTGSTAYALSAGGPIVDPRAECLVIVPVSPHMIFSRAVVLSPSEVVEITVEKAKPEAVLSIDGGEGCPLEPGARVRICRHPRPLRFVRLSGPGFVERLRAKLRLPS